MGESRLHYFGNTPSEHAGVRRWWSESTSRPAPHGRASHRTLTQATTELPLHDPAPGSLTVKTPGGPEHRSFTIHRPQVTQQPEEERISTITRRI